MLLTACEKQKVSLDDPLDDSMSTITSMSADMNTSFLVISKTDKLPKGLEKAIASANGIVDKTISEIGIAVVSSDDPGFMKKAAKIQGVGEVVPNLTVQWIDPDAKMESIDFDYRQSTCERR